jgi:hypothetical protein
MSALQQLFNRPLVWARRDTAAERGTKANCVYFSLDVEGVEQVPDDGGMLHLLRPGRSYPVIVRASASSVGGPSARGVPRTEIELALSTTNGNLELGPNTAVWTPASGDCVVFRTRLFVAETGEDQRGALILRCNTRSASPNDKGATVVAEFDAHIGRAIPASIHDFFENVHIQPALPVLRQIAVLHVSRVRDDKWEISGWNDRQKQLSAVEVPAPQGPGQTWREDLDSAMLGRLWRHFKPWSISNLSKLRTWLSALKAAYGDDLILAITGGPEAAFPWELAYADLNDNGHEAPLGAELTIVRWQFCGDIGHKPQDAAQWDPFDLETGDAAVCAGEVQAFLDDTLPGAVAERQALGGFQTHIHNSLPELLQALKTMDRHKRSCALVFAGCHADYGEEQRVRGEHTQGEIKEVALLAGGASLSVDDLWDIDAFARAARPVVFFNACHSARLLSHHGMPWGLLVPVLLRVARGYVGTLARIESGLAGRMSQELLTKAREAGEVEIARYLRDLRREAYAAWKNKDAHSDLLAYRYLYVYYGNPFVKLRLLPKPAATDGEIR